MGELRNDICTICKDSYDLSPHTIEFANGNKGRNPTVFICHECLEKIEAEDVKSCARLKIAAMERSVTCNPAIARVLFW